MHPLGIVFHRLISILESMHTVESSTNFDPGINAYRGAWDEFGNDGAVDCGPGQVFEKPKEVEGPKTGGGLRRKATDAGQTI